MEPTHIISFTEKSRKYDCEMYSIDQSPPNNIGPLKEFYRVWKSACGRNIYPAKGDLTFEKLKGWHSSIRITDIGQGLYTQKKIKLIGEEFARHWGKEAISDKIRSKEPPTQKNVDGYYQFFEYLYENHYCIGRGVVAGNDGKTTSMKWIDLPLSNDGKKITHCIAALIADCSYN